MHCSRRLIIDFSVPQTHCARFENYPVPGPYSHCGASFSASLFYLPSYCGVGISGRCRRLRCFSKTSGFRLHGTWTSSVSVPCAVSSLARLRTSSYWFATADYSTHSLRRGGATWLASRGVSLPIIRAIMDWKSDSVFGYVTPDANARASIIQSLTP
jgi:hypothetical protein